MRFTRLAEVSTILSFVFTLVSEAIKRGHRKLRWMPWIFGAVFVVSLVASLFLIDDERTAAHTGKSVEIENSPGAVLGVIQNSPGSTQHIEVNQAQAKDTRPLRDRIRAFLEKLNPKIIELLDGGQPSVCVMINTVNLPLLRELQKQPEFEAYIEVDGPHGFVSGYNNTYVGCLNDIQDVGSLVGYNLIFKDKLRR